MGYFVNFVALFAAMLVKKLLTGFIWLLSLLPLTVLYIISDILFFFLYRVLRYRYKVVAENVQFSFPEKSTVEQKEIIKNFYRYLSDLIIEMVKTRHLKKNELLKRTEFENFRIIQELYQKGKSVLVVIGHRGNWDWLSMKLAFEAPYTVYAVVKPLSDEYFDRYINTKIRSHFIKDRIIPFKQTLRFLVKHKDEMTLTVLAGDQTPHKDEIEYTTQFMNQTTAVFLGIEKIAKKLDMAVVFADLQRAKRGYYRAIFSLITDNPKSTADFEITESHVKKLEEAIRLQPENWLWSHRRWKYTR